MPVNEYKIFIPPDSLSAKNHRQWSLKEAKEYLSWLLSIKDERIRYFLEYVDVNESPDLEETLREIGKRICKMLGTELFSEVEDDRRVLTNAGYSLIHDFGLYITTVLLERKKELELEIVTKPPSDYSYHLPAIRYPNGRFVDVIHASISKAWSVLKGQESENAWLKVYQSCMQR